MGELLPAKHYRSIIASIFYRNGMYIWDVFIETPDSCEPYQKIIRRSYIC